MELKKKIEEAATRADKPKTMRCRFVDLEELLSVIKQQDKAIGDADLAVQKATNQVHILLMERDIARAERNDLIVRFANQR